MLVLTGPQGLAVSSPQPLLPAGSASTQGSQPWPSLSCRQLLHPPLLPAPRVPGTLYFPYLGHRSMGCSLSLFLDSHPVPSSPSARCPWPTGKPRDGPAAEDYHLSHNSAQACPSAPRQPQQALSLSFPVRPWPGPLGPGSMGSHQHVVTPYPYAREPLCPTSAGAHRRR